MTKVYSNKEKKSVTNMRARDLDAADLDKFTGVGSNCSMTKKEINTNNFGPKSSYRNRRQIEVKSRHRRQRKSLRN